MALIEDIELEAGTETLIDEAFNENLSLDKKQEAEEIRRKENFCL